MMNKKLTVGAVVAIALGVAVALGVFKGDSGEGSRLAAPDPKNASYMLDGDGTVRLVNGISVVNGPGGEADVITTRYFGNEARGDLNGDDIDDVAFVMTVDRGGSGTFYFVAALLSTPAGWVGSNAVLLGDRIHPQSTQIVGDLTLVVNYADRRPNEPFAASPSLNLTRRLRLKNGILGDISER